MADDLKQPKYFYISMSVLCDHYEDRDFMLRTLRRISAERSDPSDKLTLDRLAHGLEKSVGWPVWR